MKNKRSKRFYSAVFDRGRYTYVFVSDTPLIKEEEPFDSSLYNWETMNRKEVYNAIVKYLPTISSKNSGTIKKKMNIPYTKQRITSIIKAYNDGRIKVTKKWGSNHYRRISI